MRKIFLILLIIFFRLTVPAFAKSISTINGSSHLSKGEYDSLKVNGCLVFEHLFIKDSLVVNGSVQGKNLKCNTIKSNGSVDIDGLRAQGIESNGSFSGKNIDITGDAEFNGEVDIETGKLHNIQITSTKSKIIDTKVNGNIRVKKVNQGWSFFGFKSNESSPQILELKGHSLVKGDIAFEEDGEVHLFEEAKREGKIVKAKVIQR